MKALVVGGAGFIGTHLCGTLLDKEIEVVCVDDLSMGTEENLNCLINRKGFSLYKTDASNTDELKIIFQNNHPDIVFHLAANSDIQASAKRPEIEYKNTYSTTFSVLSCMKDTGVKKIFFSSTSAVYGDKRDLLLDENTPNLMPISYYGAAKLGSEALISAFTYMNNMQSLVFRFPNIIGPNLTHGVIYDFIRKLEKNPSSLLILGDGNQIKQYMYVSDLINAIMRFVFSIPNGMTLYNVGTEGGTSVNKIAETVCKEMGLSETTFEYTGGESGWKGDIPRFKYCLDKVHSAGWRAEYTSDEAVVLAVKDNWEKSIYGQ